jgi:Carboxypeptidase regulatory-like domain
MSRMTRQFQVRTFLLVVAILGWVPHLRADVTGSILGVVKDPTAAVLPGVEVSAINLDTNLVQRTRTDGTGEYRILALPVGRYRVEAALTGFQKFVATGIVLSVNEQHRVDVTLQLGNGRADHRSERSRDSADRDHQYPIGRSDRPEESLDASAER